MYSQVPRIFDINLAKKRGSEEIYEGSRLTFSEKNIGGAGSEAPRKMLTFLVGFPSKNATLNNFF